MHVGVLGISRYGRSSVAMFLEHCVHGVMCVCDVAGINKVCGRVVVVGWLRESDVGYGCLQEEC